jgi:hypothetical protein
MKRRATVLAALAAATTLVSLATFVAVTKASPPSGVTPTVLARGTYPRFFVSSLLRPGGVNYAALTLSPVDMVVRKHDYAPGGSTGWHRHPGPVFITVTEGQLTFYEADDGSCTPHVVSAGEGYVDSGTGHIGRNETTEPAQDVSVIIAPVGGSFRSELSAPNPSCGF